MNKKIAILTILIMLFNIASTGCIGYQQSEACKLIPDSNLARAIRSELGIDRDETIYQSDLERLTKLDTASWLCCFKCRIFDITGLEYAINLKELRIINNKGINDFTSITNFHNLTKLQLNSNQISDVSFLANLTNLRTLCLHDNQINNISPLVNLTNLTELSLWDNQIKDITSLANLTNLVELDIWNNQISNISPLINNKGISKNDSIILTDNPLNEESLNTYIPELKERGVSILTDACIAEINIADLIARTPEQPTI